jgi:hypothetical protein
MALSLAVRRATRTKHIAALTAVASTLLAAITIDSKEEDESHRIGSCNSNTGASLPTDSTPLFTREASRSHCGAVSDDPGDGAVSIYPQFKRDSGFLLRRRQTLRRLDQSATKMSVATKYEINPIPLGEGAFGEVFLGTDRATGEMVAVKKIWKEFTEQEDFQREMTALLQIRSHGGHPHICAMRDNFDESDHFSLVLDLIKGGEMFDYLVDNGAYSELDGECKCRYTIHFLEKRPHKNQYCLPVP